jgi:hypothetical protein
MAVMSDLVGSCCLGGEVISPLSLVVDMVLSGSGRPGGKALMVAMLGMLGMAAAMPLSEDLRRGMVAAAVLSGLGRLGGKAGMVALAAMVVTGWMVTMVVIVATMPLSEDLRRGMVAAAVF